VLYELISGKPPFDAPNLPALATAIMTREPTPLEELVNGVPRGLANVVALCLAKRREERIQSIAALVRALAPFAPAQALTLAERIERISHGRSGASSSISVPPAGSPSARRWLIPIALGALIAITIAVWPRREPAQALRTSLGESRSLALRAKGPDHMNNQTPPSLPPEPTRAAPKPASISSPIPSVASAEPPPEPAATASSAAPVSTAPKSEIQRDGLRDRK
jgi:serine/threonine-protein kinase